MKNLLARRLLVVCISLFAVGACSGKKDQAQIKKLQKELETLNEEHSTEVDDLNKRCREKEEMIKAAESKANALIQELTNERNQALAEASNLKREVERVEEASRTAVPKDASSPANPEFNTANEPAIVGALASITGDKTGGSGFVVAVDGKRHLYTSAQVLAGNSRVTIATKEGRKLTKFGNLEIAEGNGIVRMELLEADDVPALELAADNGSNSATTALTSLGISAGSVVSGSGNSYSQTVDAVEIDPSMLQGKSGGALVESANGKVVALIVNQVAEQEELWADPGVSGEQLFKAFRINRKLVWEPVPVAAFLAESRKISDYNRLTRVTLALAALTPGETGLAGLETTVEGSHTALSVLTDAKDLPFVVEFLTLHEQLVSKKLRMRSEDLIRRYENMISSAVARINRSDDGFDPTKNSSYHRPLAERSVKWRKNAMDRLLAVGARGIVTPDAGAIDPRGDVLDTNPNGQNGN